MSQNKRLTSQSQILTNCIEVSHSRLASQSFFLTRAVVENVLFRIVKLWKGVELEKYDV